MRAKKVQASNTQYKVIFTISQIKNAGAEPFSTRQVFNNIKNREGSTSLE
jgi:hypothetical protein